MADSLRALTPSVGITVATGFRVNGWVLGFTALICVTAALAAGIAPALFSARADVAAALKEGGRTGTAGGHTQRMNGALVVAEVAIATVALIGAGLFARSLQNARSIYPGFQKHDVLLGRFYLGGSGRSERESKAFCENLRRRLQSEAGVADVSYADFAPLGSTAGPWDDLQVEGYVPAAAERMTVNRALISPGYFRTLGIPLLAGRDFTTNEDTDKFQTAIVNESFARRYFGGANPLGRKIKCHRAWATVVGLVKDSKYFHVAEAPRPFVYASFHQRYGIESQLYFFIRTKGDPLQAAGALRRDVAALAPDIGTFYPMPLSEWMEVTMLPQKIAASLLGALGLMSLFLAAIGLYSVMAYAVGQRTQEIGVRIALGALPGDIFRDVLRRGLVLTGAGLVVGCAVAFAITRLIDAMLVKVVASDPITFVAAAVFLTLTAAAASAVPAWRAMKVDPILALRRE
jgi:predicted permease